MRALALTLVLLMPTVFAAEDKPLQIPQVEGENQGRVIGRAIACGVAQDRVGPVVAVNRQRMMRAVGPAFTEDRYLPALDRAIAFETSLPRPSDAAGAKAITAFEAFEGKP